MRVKTKEGFYTMKTVLLILATLSEVFAAPTKTKNSQSDFIIGGRDADSSAWPWQAKLTDNGRFFCGGTLLDNDIVITAAHCTDSRDITSIGIVLGNRHIPEITDQNISISKMFTHSDYKDYIDGFDIAILCLEKNVTITPEVSPIPEVASLGEDFENDDHSCYITGWGLVSKGNGRKRRKRPNKKRDGAQRKTATTLQEAATTVISNNRCNSKRFWDGRIKPSNICAFHKKTSACEGDSGGPLVCRKHDSFVLVGITSWGARSCKNYPSVFTRLSVYSTWIQNAKRMCRMQTGNTDSE